MLHLYMLYSCSCCPVCVDKFPARTAVLTPERLEARCQIWGTTVWICFSLEYIISLFLSPQTDTWCLKLIWSFSPHHHHHRVCVEMPPATGGPVGYTPPEGGWGWAVVVGAFISIGFSYAFPKSITVFFKEIEVIFNATSSQVSWISSIMLAVMYAGGQCHLLLSQLACAFLSGKITLEPKPGCLIKLSDLLFDVSAVLMSTAVH